MKRASGLIVAGLVTILAAGFALAGCGDNDNVMGPGQAVNFEGKVRGVEGRDVQLSGGWTVVTDDGTQVLRDGQPISLGQLQVGEMVRVVGQLESDPSTVRATRINAF